MLHWATGMLIKIPWPPGLQSAIWALGLPCPAAGLGSLRNCCDPPPPRLPSEVTAGGREARRRAREELPRRLPVLDCRRVGPLGKVEMGPILTTKK